MFGSGTKQRVQSRVHARVFLRMCLISVTRVQVGLWTVGGGPRQGFTFIRADSFHDTHDIFNLAGGFESTSGLSPLIFADLKNLQCSHGCAVMADVHLELHPSGD